MNATAEANLQLGFRTVRDQAESILQVERRAEACSTARASGALDPEAGKCKHCASSGADNDNGPRETANSFLSLPLASRYDGVDQDLLRAYLVVLEAGETYLNGDFQTIAIMESRLRMAGIDRGSIWE